VKLTSIELLVYL